MRKAAILTAILFGVEAANAQLAITEAMSSASTNLGTAVVIQNSDWWELSNLGTNTIDLNGYSFNDNQGGFLGSDPTPFTGLTIGPGESIVFFQSNSPASTTVDQFRSWWGLSPTVQVVIFVANGLGSTGDGLRVWRPDALDDADVVDSVDFLDARRGSTFTYNPVTGAFDTFSTNGVGGAFKAATADDIGSPGVNIGPIPLVIAQQPTNTAVNPGDIALFSVTVSGLPRPRFQWFFNGSPISGATSKKLSVTNAQSDQLGPYRVEVDNGAQALVSSNAFIILNAAPERPSFAAPLLDQNVFVGQSVTFSVIASGVPQPTFQWRFNGTNIGGATAATYTIGNPQLADTGIYSVVAQNSQGRATNQATLTVTTRPLLVITEIMAQESTNGPSSSHNDWWELSNLDDHSVDLTGYRFDDSSASLAFVFTVTNKVVIAPGESIIFVENTTPDEFRKWWGASNLRTNLQIITYRGAGLGLSGLGDAIAVWNSGASADFDTIVTESFSTATAGFSFSYDADTSTFGDLSVEGLNGAFRAEISGDIGSPGFIRNRPEPRVLNVIKQGSDYSLKWTTQPTRQYSVEFKNHFGETTWTHLTTLPASGLFLNYTDVNPAGAQRFYHITLEP